MLFGSFEKAKRSEGPFKDSGPLKLAWLYGQTVNVGHGLGVTPLTWDSATGLLKWSRGGQVPWHFVKYFTFLNQFLLFGGFLQYKHLPNFDLWIVQSISFVGFLVVCLFQVVIVHQGQDSMLLVNRWVTIAAKFRESFVHRDCKCPRWYKTCLLVMAGTTLSSIPVSITFALLYLQNPTLPIVGTAILLPAAISESWKYVLVGPFFVFVTGSYLSAALLAESILILVFTTSAFLRELRSTNSKVTRGQLRSPQNRILYYRSLQLLFCQVNAIGRPYLITATTSLVISIAMICNFSVIRLHPLLSTETLILTLTSSVSISFYIVLAYLKFGDVNELSKKFLKSWLKTSNATLTGHDKRLLCKYIRSMRAIRVELGNFGSYTKATSIRFVGKLLLYNAKFVLMAGKFV